jgi:hypothetical protein
MTRQTPRRYGQGSPVGDQIRNNVSKQNLGSIMRPDPEMGTQDAGRSLAALRNGDYQGLEGIQFGVMSGNPVAILPDGHAVVISAGEAMKGITERNKRRTQIAEELAFDEDIKHAANENRNTMRQMLDKFEFGEDVANGYMSLFEGDPFGTMSGLLEYDLSDRRASREAELNLRKTQRAARNSRMTQGLNNMLTTAGQQGVEQGTATRVAAGHLQQFALAGQGMDDMNLVLTDPSALSDLQMAVQSTSKGTISAARNQLKTLRDQSVTDQNPQGLSATDAVSALMASGSPEVAALTQTVSSLFQQSGIPIDVGAAVTAILGGEEVVADPAYGQAIRSLQSTTVTGRFTDPGNTIEYEKEARQIKNDMLDDFTPEVLATNNLNKLLTLAQEYSDKSGFTNQNKDAQLKHLFESPDVMVVLRALGGQTDYFYRVLKAKVEQGDLQAGQFTE